MYVCVWGGGLLRHTPSFGHANCGDWSHVTHAKENRSFCFAFSLAVFAISVFPSDQGHAIFVSQGIANKSPTVYCTALVIFR